MMDPSGARMPSNFRRSLFLKSLLVGTPFDEAAKQLRWLFGARKRRKNPELWELSLEEKWLPSVMQKLLAIDSCGVDVGSHLGSFLSLLLKYAPKGRHIAFEASEVKCQWLRKRFRDVEIFPYAVADEAGMALFTENVERPGYSRLQTKSGAQKGSVSYEVNVCRLDDMLLGRTRIDLIKLDIEGGELAALRGATELIQKWQPAILFECGSEYFLNQQGLSRKDLYEFVSVELRYKIFCFADFLFNKGEMMFDEFRKCGLYPFRAFNFVALPRSKPTPIQTD
jgi:FkbM family methyltransferase